jgi:transposase
MSTTKRLVSDELWRIVEPLLASDILWRMLRAELGYGSGATCWKRLRDWQKAGVWRQHVLVGKGLKRVGV